jgi:hypothetical protein
VVSAKSITNKEEAPVVIGIKNRSERAIGLGSDYSRLLRVRLEHNEGPTGISFKLNYMVN